MPPALTIYLTVTFFPNSQTRNICSVCICVWNYASQTVFFKYMMICLIDKFAFLLIISTAFYILGALVFWYYMEEPRNTLHNVVGWNGVENVFLPFSLLFGTLIIMLLFLQSQPNLLKPFLQMMNQTTALWELQKGTMTSSRVGSARWTSHWGTFLFLSSTNGNNAMAASA